MDRMNFNTHKSAGDSTEWNLDPNENFPLYGIVLPHSVSFTKQVCLSVRPRLSNPDRGRGKWQPLRLETKEPLHCAVYVLLTRSHSPHPTMLYIHLVYRLVYECLGDVFVGDMSGALLRCNWVRGDVVSV